MLAKQSSNTVPLTSKQGPESYALRLGEGLEFAEFSPALWRLTIYHVLGVSRQVNLGHSEAYLLEYFVTHPGQMISRQELLDYAWADRVVSQGSLNQAVSNLRGMLGDDQKREIILTVPRHGYQFSTDALMDWAVWLTQKATITGISEVEVDAPPPPESERQAVAATGRWQLPALWGLAAVLVLTLLLGVFGPYFYSLFPPYASDRVETLHSQVTLLAINQEELDNTKHFLQPVLKRIDALGGGQLLINRLHNYLEFNCLRSDGTLRTLQVHVARIQALKDEYLQGCLQ